MKMKIVLGTLFLNLEVDFGRCFMFLYEDGNHFIEY
jgi:hypothetical protein